MPQPEKLPVKAKMGRPGYKASDKDRATVKAMTCYGIPQHDIARVIGIHDDTLRRYYRHELDTAAIEANAQVGQSLFHMATKGKNVAAAIWWSKSRMGWKDTVQIANEGGTPFVIGVVTGVTRAGD